MTVLCVGESCRPRISRQGAQGRRAVTRRGVVAVGSRDSERSRGTRLVGHRARVRELRGGARVPTSRRSTSRCPTRCTTTGRCGRSRPASTCCARSRTPATPPRSPSLSTGGTAKSRAQRGLHVPLSPAHPSPCSALSSGQLGRLRLISGAFSGHTDNPNDVRLDPELDGGSLMDVGVYR